MNGGGPPCAPTRSPSPPRASSAARAAARRARAARAPRSRECRAPSGSAVFDVTTRAKRSGSSATTRRPTRPPQSWQTSVIAAQVERLDERAQPCHVARVAVVRRPRSGLSERPNPTRSGATTRRPAAAEDRDHLAIEIRPGRLAVQTQDRRRHRAVPRPRSGSAATPPSPSGTLCVVRRDGPTRQIAEPVVGCAHELHRAR